MISVLESGDRIQIGFWAGCRDTLIVREFLSLMSRRPDPEIARLAKQLLARNAWL
jgi:hypothetical protein